MSTLSNQVAATTNSGTSGINSNQPLTRLQFANVLVWILGNGSVAGLPTELGGNNFDAVQAVLHLIDTVR